MQLQDDAKDIIDRCIHNIDMIYLRVKRDGKWQTIALEQATAIETLRFVKQWISKQSE